MTEQEQAYHSALSQCAELLDNMPDGHPITDTPRFLAAKLEQLHNAGAARQGGNTSDNGSSVLAQAGVRAEPADYVLLPRVMTAAMINAWSGGITVSSDNVAARTTFQDAWKRVIKAAPATPAQVPAAEVRAQALREAANACEAEKVHVHKWHPSSEGDEAYNAGGDDCAAAIRSLAQSSTADSGNTDEKGGDHE